MHGGAEAVNLYAQVRAQVRGGAAYGPTPHGRCIGGHGSTFESVKSGNGDAIRKAAILFA